MMDGASAITHVTDTAYWAAAFRARQTQRPNAAFHDVLAGILSGERGRKIARAMPRAAMAELNTVVRTSAVDRLISEALALGTNVVLNLGAGLDGRPYRMSLPTHLRWVEVDFPSIIEFKSAALDKHSPVCNLQRIGMDLLDLPLRHDLFSRCLGISEPSLVITEGILVYLSNDEAASLARAILDNPAVRYWIQDYDNAGSRPLPRGWEKKLRAAPFRLQAPDWFGFFEQCGWKPLTIITSADEAKRIHRPYPYDFPYGLLMRALPSGMRQKIMSLSGAVLMQRI